MPDRRTHRGPHPEDARLFGAGAAPVLRASAGEFCWLLDRGYAHDSSLKLVGDRHGLVARQRTAVSRCCCSAAQASGRRARQVGDDQLPGAAVWLDGYNVLTSVEAALAGGVILAARDGTYRDMASMHGSYRKVAETLPALELIGCVLDECRFRECLWLLDRPVSNSGRLKGIIEGLAEERGWPWRVELSADPDAALSDPGDCPDFRVNENGTVPFAGKAAALGTTEILEGQAVVAATADSAILDRCPIWFNLARETISRRVPQARVLELTDTAGVS